MRGKSVMFEQLYKEEWLEAKGRLAFLLGIAYSIMGIFSAMVLFPDDPGLASVAFTSLLLVPSLHQLFSLEANKMAGEARFSIARLLWDHWDIFVIYLFLFLGALLAFGFFAAMWPPVATSAIFTPQTKATMALGSAYGGRSAVMFEYLSNNARVLLISLVTSFFYGAGAIFIIIWNASAWGVFFGIQARQSAHAIHPVVQFLYSIVLVSPHLILEAGSYFAAAMAGGIISKAAIREKFLSSRFSRVVQDGLYLFLFAIAFVIAAAYIEAYITPWILSSWG